MTGDTEPKYPKGTPRKHHFVPRGYLARFCRAGSDRLALFDRARDAYRDRQRPADVAHIKDYYAFETVEGELKFDVERVLSGIEAAALPVIGKIDWAQTITKDERYSLALYAAFQHTRTPTFQSTLDSLGSILAQKLAQLAPQPTNGAPMTEGQIAEELGVEMHRHATLQMMLNLAPQIANTLYQMDWVIARRPDDRTAFITTDSPFCLIPGPNHVSRPFQGIGIQTSGIFKTLPLSQSSVLLITEPGDGMASLTLTRKQVRETNIAVGAQCRNFVFGRELPLVERIVKETKIDKWKWRATVGSN